MFPSEYVRSVLIEKAYEYLQSLFWLAGFLFGALVSVIVCLIIHFALQASLDLITDGAGYVKRRILNLAIKLSLAIAFLVTYYQIFYVNGIVMGAGFLAGFHLGIWVLTFALVPTYFVHVECFELPFLLRAVRARRSLDSLIIARKPFALYLRNFDADATEYPGHHAFTGGAPVYRVGSISESQIEHIVSKYMPMYAFHNLSDSNDPDGAVRVFMPPATWFQNFIDIASSATIVIVDFEGHRPGLDKEITWLLESGVSRRTVVFCTQERWPQLADKYSNLATSILGFGFRGERRNFLPPYDKKMPEPVEFPNSALEYLKAQNHGNAG